MTTLELIFSLIRRSIVVSIVVFDVLSSVVFDVLSSKGKGLPQEAEVAQGVPGR